jgi:hypothetical protein
VNGLPPSAEGAASVRAIESALAETPRFGEDGEAAPYGQRAADALVGLVSSPGSGKKPPAEVTLHIGIDALSGDGYGEAGGGIVPSPVARAIACDAKLRTAVADPGGAAVGVGSARRVVPAALARETARRDARCVFPGCERDRFGECHHIVHWARGGRAEAANLALLRCCHHGLVHTGGWRLVGSVPEGLSFISPDSHVRRRRLVRSSSGAHWETVGEHA